MSDGGSAKGAQPSAPSNANANANASSSTSAGGSNTTGSTSSSTSSGTASVSIVTSPSPVTGTASANGAAGAAGANGAPSPMGAPNAPNAGNAAAERSKDVVLLGPPTADGQGVHVLRARNERLEAGELRALRDGQPLTGEIVTLQPRKDEPRICDVKDSFSASSLPQAHKGPAQVATNAYREGWDEIFGRSERGASSASPSTTPALPTKPSRDLN